MALAPLIAPRASRPARWMFGAPASTPQGTTIDGGTGNTIGLTVELYLGALGWTDVSPYVYYRAGSTKIPISRGRGDETSTVPPQIATVVFNNRDGRFSPRNPNGPYYGLLTRNTPIRISRLNNGIRRFRFHGEVPTWPRSSDISGKDVIATVPAAGMLRRLRQGNAPLGSALHRAYTVPSVLPGFPASLPLAAYWPCEDGANSTSIASGLSGGTPMALSGTTSPTFATNNGFFCSASLPLLSKSTWTGAVPTYTGGTDNVVSFLMDVPSTGSVNGAVLLRLLTLGTIARAEVQYLTANSGSLQLVGFNGGGGTLFTSSAITGVNGLALSVQVFLQHSGSSVAWSLQTAPTQNPTSSVGVGSASGTQAAAAVGNATLIVVNPNGTVDDTAVGHIAVEYNALTALAGSGGAVIAWQLENPDAVDSANFITSRFARLCAEQNVPAVVVQSAAFDTPDASPILMGPQLPDTFANLIQQPVDVTLGLLYEARDQLALTLRTRSTLYNQTAKLTLDYSQNQLSASLIPLDDDAFTRNDVTVQRIGGSKAVAQLTSGALSMQQPPNGVGDYPNSYNVSMVDDTTLADAAGWRLHMGTVNEPRYPQVSLNLRHETFTSNVDLMNAALTLEIGDRIVIKNPPTPDFPPDDISLIVQGYTETLGVFEHDMVLNCSPESPYRVGILEDIVLGHADTDGSTLAQTYPLGTETTLSVSTTGAATGSPLWTTNAGDFPFDVNIGGERMTVTNITGAFSPQAFTVTRSVNSVVKTQTSGTDVRLWQPLILGL